MNKFVLAGMALVGFVLPAFAFANDGSPQPAAVTTISSPTFANDGTPATLLGDPLKESVERVNGPVVPMPPSDPRR